MRRRENPTTAIDAEVRIRRAAPEDLPKIEKIYHAAYRGLESYAYEDHWTPEERRLLSREYLQWAYDEEPEGFFVVEVSGEPAGFVAVHTWGRGETRQGEIVEIAVDPQRQGLGLGKRLLDRAEAYAHRRGCRRLILWVGVGNARAIRLYKRRGYREATRYERWMKMVKPLTPSATDGGADAHP